MNATTVNTIINGLVAEIGGLFTSILPTIFGFAALIVVLFFAVKWVLSILDGGHIYWSKGRPRAYTGRQWANIWSEIHEHEIEPWGYTGKKKPPKYFNK